MTPDNQPDEAQGARQRLIEKLRKLQRMTTERGASEAEAAHAAAMYHKLVLEHQIASSELEIRADAKNCIKDSYTVIRSKRAEWDTLAIGIEKLFGTICWMEQTREDLLGLGFEVETISIVYYGFPVDVAGSIATLSVCALAMEQAIAELPKRGLKKIERESFEIGMAKRIRERLSELRKISQNEIKGQGALVVLKDQLVKDEFSKLGQKLYRSAVRERSIDGASYAKGYAAGNAVNIGAQSIRTGQARRLT